MTLVKHILSLIMLFLNTHTFSTTPASATSQQTFTAQAAQQEARMQQQNIIDQITEITERAIQKNKHPQELRSQLHPLCAELETHKEHLHQNITSQLLEIAVKASVLDASIDITSLSPAEKEFILHELSWDAKAAMLEYLGDRIFNTKKPFKIPEGTKSVSQLDMLFILMTALTADDATYQAGLTTLHEGMMACVNAKDVLAIQRQLGKSEYLPLLPQSILGQFNTRNPLKLKQLLDTIKRLMVLYN